jgi:hypothetical protein
MEYSITDSFTKCNAIIVSGKNKGKYCTRVNCWIKGHDKYKKGKGKCGSIIKFGKNKGSECGRINCTIHAPDIVYYFNFPKFVHDSYFYYRSYEDVEKSRILIDMYEKYKNRIYDENIYKNDCIKDIKYVLEVVDNTHRLSIKMRYAIYMFYLLDTESMVKFRFKHPKFNKVVYNKVEEFYEDKDLKFSTYMKNNFEINKKYLSKTKNRINLIRNYIRARMCFLNLYKKIKTDVEESKISNFYCIIL